MLCRQRTACYTYFNLEETMKVKDLKTLLENAPDDATVVVSGHDHGYRECSCTMTTALKENWYSWTEDFGEEKTPEAEYGKRLPVLLVGA